jgi:DNA replication protein DnaC
LGPSQQAAEAGIRVAWFPLEELSALMRAQRSDGNVIRVVTRILRASLIVIDEIRLLAARQTQPMEFIAS